MMNPHDLTISTFMENYISTKRLIKKQQLG